MVLRAPAHTAELRSLARAFPSAIVVMLHRDIVETVASGASLFATFRSTYSDEVDAVDVGRFQANQTELWLRRAIDFRQSAAAAAVTFLDVAYTDLVADPVAALSRVYAAAGLELPADAAAMVERYEHDQPRHTRGVHRCTAAQFGLDERGLRERFAFLEGAWG